MPIPGMTAVGALLVDGVPMLLNQGAVAGPLAPDNLILGDVGWSTDGSVEYDNVYLGPALP